MNEFESNNKQILKLIEQWEPRLMEMSEKLIFAKRNMQERTIRQIVGHMVDSASNNTHRIIHLQYQPNPNRFPDYANKGNNDKWIAIQNFQEENWEDLVQLWKYTNLHYIHVVRNVNVEKLDNTWISALENEVTLREMIKDYLRHFKLHLGEIEELVQS